jgi:hypothetical protein
MKKVTIIVAVVFVALLVGVFMMMDRKPEKGITRLAISGVSKEAVDQIEITGPQPISIKRVQGKWVLGDGREAEQNAVNTLLDTLPKIQSSDMVTASPERFAALEVDDAKGTRVKILSGEKTLTEFVIGKATGGGANVRTAGDAVYKVTVSPYIFSKPAASWHHLKLFEGKVDEVSKLEVALKGAAPYSLIKKDGKWQLEDPKLVPDGFRFDDMAGGRIASTLVGMSAKEILDKDPGSETTKLDKDMDVFAFVGKDDVRQELRVGAPLADNKTVYASVAGKNDVYAISTASLTALRKSPTDLRDLSMIQLEKEKVRKLSITDGKTEIVFDKQGTEWKIAKSSEKVPSDFELDPARIERRLGMFTRAKGIKLSPERSGAKTGLDRSTARVSATLEDGKSVALTFGEKIKDEEREVVYARGNADKEVYFVAKGLRDGLLGGLATFKKQAGPAAGGMPGMPNMDPSQLNSLPPEVRAQIMQQMQQKQGGAGAQPGGPVKPMPFRPGQAAPQPGQPSPLRPMPGRPAGMPGQQPMPIRPVQPPPAHAPAN